MKPTIIKFNGLGQPTTVPVKSGHIAILVQGQNREIVRIELTGPREYGPQLHHATNQSALAADVARFWEGLDKDELSTDRDWIIDCPSDISSRATF